MKQFLKKNMLLILSLALVFALVGSTYAYLAATDSKIINSFKLAQIDTKITEEAGDNGRKEVSVTNKDVSSVYVRARVLVSAGEVGAEKINFEAKTASQPAAKEITVEYNSTDWWYDGSDWFYYQTVLPGKAADGTMYSTEPVIYRVLVGDGVDTTKNFEVEVYQESVLTSATDYVQKNAEAAFGKS